MSAHLAIAERIAAGDWQDKDEVVGQWICRASALAEQMIDSGRSRRVAAAASGGERAGRRRPAAAADRSEAVGRGGRAGRRRLEATIDGDADGPRPHELAARPGVLLRRRDSHRRGEADLAHRATASWPTPTLSPRRTTRQEMPDTDFVLGRLYFQIGAVHAVHRSDHDVACQWYDRAIEPC